MKVLIFSQGPVPVPEQTKVEGGGLRCWGLAKGLLANSSGLEITVAYHCSYQQEEFTNHYEGIEITTWDYDNISSLVTDYDSIIVSYCMGDLSVKVVNAIQPNQQLILDCYVPIYVEASARDTDDLDREYHAFQGELGRLAHVLRRGDIFLCANEAQKKFYKGVLAAVGRVNPATYGQDSLLVVPYGIYREAPMALDKPITKMIPKNSIEKKILWFGGIYPWFDLRSLVDAVKLLNKNIPAKLIIVGAKNPFNDHPDFTRPYTQLIEHIEKIDTKDQVILQDWVEFNKRADWYLDSDVVVVINKEGEENELSWRTRLVDFLWADLPLLTNGGDPLGEALINNNAAQRLNGLTPEAISAGLEAMLKNKKQLQKFKNNLSILRDKYYWDVVTKDLAKIIVKHVRANDLVHYGDQMVVTAPDSRKTRVRKAVGKLKMIPGYARKHGLRSTYYVTRTIARNQFTRAGFAGRKQPSIVMVSHQLDLSGAPYVFIDLARAIKESTTVPVEFHTFNPIHRDNVIALNKIKIKPKIHLNKDISLEIVEGDVVVLNTIAHSPVLKDTIYHGLEDGRIKQLIWFIHEDDPDQLFNKSETQRITDLLNKNKISMYIAAEKAMQNYRHHFKNKNNIHKQPYKYVIPNKFQKVRDEKDFDKIKFILTGNIADGRKGQLPVMYAFGAFINQYYNNDSKGIYRDFDLTYVGLSNDFLSKQVLEHSGKLLGRRFKHYGQVSHERSSEIMLECNVTICYSLRECLPLFVFEGMAAGHPLLRNDSSGMVEQLFPGKNGYLLASDDYNQVVDTIETILNKNKVSNKLLANMSRFSNKVAIDQANNTYDPITKAINDKFNE